VRKSERRLVARCNPGPALEMKVALGRQPLGPKLRKGDQRTPEGNYVVSGPAARNRFHRFIPIDYPSRRDADVGLERGTISAAEHARILARRSHDHPPPQDTALGGELGLHGEGPRWQGESAGLDWTFGCVAVRDHEIDFLAERVKVGTPVWIVP
jgi:murein L,D-transpeptidase YafK